MTDNSLPKHILDQLRLGIDLDRHQKGKRALRQDGKPSGVFLWKLSNDMRTARRRAAFSPAMRKEFDDAIARTRREDLAAYGKQGGRAPDRW